MSRDYSALARLDAVIATRRLSTGDKSYVASLLHSPSEKVLKKVAEESAEFIMVATTLSSDLSGACHLQDGSSAEKQYQEKTHQLRKKLLAEAADLQFHLQVALAYYNVSLADVAEVLAMREGLGGLDEKAARH